MAESVRILELALKGLESELAKIDNEIAEIKERFRPVRTVRMSKMLPTTRASREDAP
jgi:hypothetical protein